MTTYPGSCHCGAIKIAFTSGKAPEAMRVGRCACSFEFRAEPGSLSRYRFGLGITDYLLCAKCGTYVGAVMPDEGGQNGDGLGIVNVNSLDIRDTFDPAPPLHVYDGEDEARRRARRRKFWMKTTVIA